MAFDPQASSFARMVRQVEGLRQFFTAFGVPAGAVQVRVVAESSAAQTPRAELRVDLVPTQAGRSLGW
jgi:hypothetical protein